MIRLVCILFSSLMLSATLNSLAFGQDFGGRGDRGDRGGRGDRGDRGSDRGGFGGFGGGDSSRGGFGGPPGGFGGGGFGGPPGGFGGGGFGGPPGGFGGGGFGGPPGGFGGGGFGGPPGGFSGGDRESRFGSMMDSNGNGKIDQEEIDRMPSFVRDMMKSRGVELKAGMSLDDMRNNARAAFGRGENGQPGNDQNRNGATGTPLLTPYKMKPRKPMTLTLPPAYSDVDSDLDGQIAMHEWMATRRPDIEQFDNLDTDFDGFLIPEELLAADTAAANQAAVASTERKRLMIVTATPTRAKSNTGQPGNGQQPNGQPVFGQPGSSDNNGRSPWGSGDPATMAKESFARLDSNQDGFIDTDEWQNSRRTRGMFEQAGIRLDRMSLADYTQHYVRLIANGGGR